MTPTDADLALLLDPAHEVPGWWSKYVPYACPSCKKPLHGNPMYPPFEDLIGGYRCLSCRILHSSEFAYTGPPFSTSPVACFQWVTPVLLELGIAVLEDGETNTVAAFDEDGNTICEVVAVSRSAYAEVATRALEWAHNNMPERLAEAVRRVKEKNREQY